MSLTEYTTCWLSAQWINQHGVRAQYQKNNDLGYMEITQTHEIRSDICNEKYNISNVLGRVPQGLSAPRVYGHSCTAERRSSRQIESCHVALILMTHHEPERQPSLSAVDGARVHVNPQTQSGLCVKSRNSGD